MAFNAKQKTVEDLIELFTNIPSGNANAYKGFAHRIMKNLARIPDDIKRGYACDLVMICQGINRTEQAKIRGVNDRVLYVNESDAVMQVYNKYLGALNLGEVCVGELGSVKVMNMRYSEREVQEVIEALATACRQRIQRIMYQRAEINNLISNPEAIREYIKRLYDMGKKLGNVPITQNAQMADELIKLADKSPSTKLRQGLAVAAQAYLYLDTTYSTPDYTGIKNEVLYKDWGFELRQNSNGTYSMPIELFNRKMRGIGKTVCSAAEELSKKTGKKMIDRDTRKNYGLK